MHTSELLFFLGNQLAQLQKTFSKFPHVRYTFTAALDRIEEITSLRIRHEAPSRGESHASAQISGIAVEFT